MKLVFFADCLPREVHKQLLDSYRGRVNARVTNEYFLAYLEAFVQLGYEVHSVVSDFARSAIETEFDINSSGGGLNESIDPRTGIHYDFINTDGPKFLRLIKKMIGNYRLLKKFQRNLQSATEYEHLLVGNYSGQVMYAGPCLWFRHSRFARNWKVKYLAFMADYPYENFRPRWLYYLTKLQWRWLKGADAVLVESELAGRELFAPRIGNHVFSISAPVAEPVIQQYSQIEPLAHNDSTFRFTIVYTGTFYLGYALDSLVETIRLAEIKYPGKYRWRFAGWGTHCLDQLEELAARPSSGVELLGVLDTTNLIKLQKSADVLISLRKNSTPDEKLWNRYAYSAKLFDYLLVARPVLATDVPAIESGARPFLNLIDSEDPEDILAAIERICEHLPSQKLLDQGRDYVIEHHSTPALARELKKILELIV
jgi:glycosyltransferase involved in cell wall biosynthesis